MLCVHIVVTFHMGNTRLDVLHAYLKRKMTMNENYNLSQILFQMTCMYLWKF